MRKLGSGIIGRVGALAIGVVTVLGGCGDNGVLPIDAPDIDAAIDAALPPAQLSISPLTSDFGSVTVGMASSASFTVSNTGGITSGSISAQIMGAAASNFSIETNSCTTLAPNATCTIAVSFAPASPGGKTANLSVSATPGGSVSSSINGTGVGIGNLTISPSSNAFGNVVVGATSATTATFTVTNTGGTPTGALVVTAGGSDPGDFVTQSDTCGGVMVPAAGTCVITVSFQPGSAGAKSASFQITGAPGGTVNAAVSGTGLAQALLAINPTLVDFGSVVTGGMSSNQTFTVTNTGGVASGTLTPALSGTDATHFTIVSGNCGAALNPNSSCNVTLQFRPTSTGAKAAQLAVSATPGGTANATVQGTGLAPGQISINPSSFPFADTTVGQVSASQMFTVTNNGGAPTGALSTALGGGDPTQFTVVASSNGCQGVVLQPAGICTIAITFSPTAGGAKTATLAVSGTPGGIATAGLNGNAIPDALLTITPASFDFGSVGTGTVTAFQTFTIRNTGGQMSGVPAVALNGPQAAQFFHVSACAAALAPNATCTVQVRFQPNINGNAVGQLDVSATPGGAVSAGVFGQGVDPAALSVSPTTINMNVLPLGGNNGNGPNGETLLGEATMRSFTVTNGGTEPTGTITFMKTGTNQADYTFTHNCTTLPAGMTCTVIVTFTPSAAGVRTASIAASATPGGSAAVAFTGTALPRLELLTPATNPFAFNPAVINTTAPQSVTVTFRNNTRSTQTLTRTLANTSTTPGGGAALDFQLNGGSCGATLLSDISCTVQVEFEPDTIGNKMGSLTYAIGGGGANNTAVQSYTGTGVDSMIITAMTTANFGNVARGAASSTLTFVVSNPAGSPTTGAIGTTMSTNRFQVMSDGCAGQVLTGGGAPCFITVMFLPIANGTITAALTVTGLPGGTTSITLTGTGVDPAQLAFTPSPTLAFGNVFSGETSDLIVRVDNTGGVPSGNVQYNKSGTDAGLYTLQQGAAQANDCGPTNTAPIAALGFCNIRVRFSPTGLTFGTKNNATLSISASPGQLVAQTIAITGTSVSTISITTPAANPFVFPTQNQGQTASQTFTVRNDSNTTVSVTNAVINPVVTDTTISMNNCTVPLTTGARTCTIVVQVSSATAGFFARTLQVNSPAGTATRALEATVRTSPNVQWDPGTAFDFGSTLSAATNGQTHVFTLRNTGEATSGALTISVTDAANYTLTNSGAGSCSLVAAGLPGGASCTVSVQYTPATGAPSGVQAAMVVAMNAGGAPANQNITGTEMPAGSLVLTLTPGLPPAAVFSPTIIGNVSATQSFTLQNTSNGTLNFTVGTTGQFARNGGDCAGSLLSGNSCTILVQFAPNTTNGTKNGTVTVDDTGSTNDPYGTLTGLAQTQAAITGVGNLTFPDTAVLRTSQMTLTLTNTGDVTSGVITQSAVGGPDGLRFSKTGCTAALLPGTSCDLVVTFAPTTTTLHTASFTVSATAGLGLTTVTLLGTGVVDASIGITPQTPQTTGPRPVGGNAVGFTTYTITNGGAVPSGNLTVTLGDLVNFSILAPVGGDCVLGTPMAAFSTCTVRVAFAPKSLGMKTTTVVASGPPANPSSAAGGALTGMATPAVTVNPTTQGFGTVLRGTMGPVHTFTFTNDADVTTGLLYTTLAGPDFAQYSIVDDDCTGTAQAAHASCAVMVQFTPAAGTTVGTKNATLTVSGVPGDSATATLSGMTN